MIKEFSNRAIDLDKIMPNVSIIFKGVSLMPDEFGRPKPAIWLSCDDIIVRTIGRDNKIEKERRVRDLIDCAFETYEERDDYYEEILKTWKNVVGMGNESLPLEKTENNGIGIKVH